MNRQTLTRLEAEAKARGIPNRREQRDGETVLVLDGVREYAERYDPRWGFCAERIG